MQELCYYPFQHMNIHGLLNMSGNRKGAEEFLYKMLDEIEGELSIVPL